jgi:arginine exporter protein ArgO
LVLAVQLLSMKKWIAFGVVAIAGLVHIHYYASVRLEAMPEGIRSSPAEINAQHQLELKSETPLQ